MLALNVLTRHLQFGFPRQVAVIDLFKQSRGSLLVFCSFRAPTTPPLDSPRMNYVKDCELHFRLVRTCDSETAIQ